MRWPCKGHGIQRKACLYFKSVDKDEIDKILTLYTIYGKISQIICSPMLFLPWRDCRLCVNQ